MTSQPHSGVTVNRVVKENPPHGLIFKPDGTVHYVWGEKWPEHRQTYTDLRAVADGLAGQSGP